MKQSRGLITRLLILYAFLLPYENALSFGGAGPWLKPYRAVGLVILIIWLARDEAGRPRIRLDVFDWGYLLIFAMGFVMMGFWYIVFTRGNISWALSELLLVAFGYALYLVMKQSSSDLHAVLRAFVIGTISSIIVFAALVGSIPEQARFAGFYENPNSLGIAVGASIILIVCRLLFGNRIHGTISYVAYALALLLLGAALLYTGSREAIVGLIASLLGITIPLRAFRPTT
ncbi:MAG: hypothetical protein LC808_25250, partial [Actinobacteria bacterium]|nr:hypothetical protein [Actinomycetota bacterium]